MRNKIIFQNIRPNFNQCCIKSLTFFKEFSRNNQFKAWKNIYNHVPSLYFVVGYFDGSLVEGRCGNSMVVWINEDHCFNLWMGGGIGSNTKAKLLGIWGVIFIAIKILLIQSTFW